MLRLIGEIDLLATLFGRVVAPRAVATELQHASVPAPVAEWMVGTAGSADRGRKRGDMELIGQRCRPNPKGWGSQLRV
jgi:hypothetical protein